MLLNSPHEFSTELLSLRVELALESNWAKLPINIEAQLHMDSKRFFKNIGPSFPGSFELDLAIMERFFFQNSKTKF